MFQVVAASRHDDYDVRMSSDAAARSRLAPAEYLATERASPDRHQYLDGQVFAMAGGSPRHALIAANVVRVLGNALLDGPCQVYTSDLRVKIEATGLYTYPDATVVCGPPELVADGGDTLLNPRVLVEVLSASTESYDRGKKFEHYRTLPSLAEYLLVAQSEVHVEHFERQADGSWRLREYRAGQRLPLPALDCELAVDDFYRKAFGAPGDGG